MPSLVRKALNQKIVRGLKPDGVFLLDAYTPDQIQHGTGGGNSTDTMQTATTLKNELRGLDFSHLAEVEREVVQGIYHSGIGAVVHAIAVKKCLIHSKTSSPRMCLCLLLPNSELSFLLIGLHYLFVNC